MRYKAGHLTLWNAPEADRFRVYLFIALALHGILILAISFKLPETRKPERTLDITLARYVSEQAPDDVDFFAQSNQQGSGDSEERLLPSVTEEAPLESEEINTQSMQPQPMPSADMEAVEPTPPTPEPPSPEPNPTQETGSTPVIAMTQTQTERVTVQQERTASSQPQPLSGHSASLLSRSMEIASLQAQLEYEQQKLAKRPRIRRLTSAPSTMAHTDAVYLDNWRRRIEAIGNLNYPDEARRSNTYGSLRLLVAVKPDGSVAYIEILQSSGHQILDDAATRIVQLAAPFQPFTTEMRKNTDLLEIIRTWKFENRAQVY